MATVMSTHDEALHEMAMDDLAALVPPGEEHRVPETVRDEVIARHEATAAKRGPYPKYELTGERAAIIRARYDGRTATIRAIAEEIGVPWYTVRDWANGRLQLRNPADAQPNGAGGLAKQEKPKAEPAVAKPKAQGKRHGTIPWADNPDEAQLSEIEAQREKRAAMIASASADDAIRADSATGWLTPKWAYTDDLGELIAAQWDGTDASLAQLAEREHFPLGVLRGWIDEHRLKPKADTRPARPLPPVTPLAVLPPKQDKAQDPAGGISSAPVPSPELLTATLGTSPGLRLDRFSAWLDSAVGAGLSVFLVPAPAEAVVLRGPGGYRVLTPRGDWPDEPISRKLVERIVRLLASGASEAAVHGVVYQAEA